MATEPADVLRELFAIPAAQIERDIADADMEALSAGLIADAEAQVADPDTQTCYTTDHIHRMLVLAAVAEAEPKVDRDHAIRVAATSAVKVAELAVDVASERGRLGELNRLLDEDESLDEDEWEVADAEANGLLEKVMDAVFVTVLRRYKLNRAADLYENDRAAFEATRRLPGA